MRRPAFAAAWGLLLSACALDLSGLGAPGAGDDAGAVKPTEDATTADQSVVNPDGVEAGDEAADEAAASDATGGGGETSTSTMDAVAPGDAGGDAPGVTCDEDGDGYLAMTGGCGGNDCCDQDAHVHPGQKSFFTQPGACGGFDYNCDGNDTPEYGAVDCQWNTFSCSGDGFAAPIPGCGVFGTFTSCSIPWYDVLSCSGNNAQQAQGCH